MGIQPSESAYTPENCWIETQSGTRFCLNNPEFKIEDIAHGLGMVARYNGQCSRFYSVAEHSMMVAQIMEDLSLGDPREGLLHDATEAYLSDVPAPFKHALPDWKAIDANLEVALRAHFKLPPKKTEGCIKADWLALFIEADALLPSKGQVFADPFNLRDQALSLKERYPIRNYVWWLSKFTFLAHYEELFQ